MYFTLNTIRISQRLLEPSLPEINHATQQESRAFPSLGRASAYLAAVVGAYIGVYLCRKNFAVAVPLLQQAFAVDKAQIGAIDSLATLTYAAGKLFWGPLVVDRLGGRICLFLTLAGVALFGGLSAFAVSSP